MENGTIKTGLYQLCFTTTSLELGARRGNRISSVHLHFFSRLKSPPEDGKPFFLGKAPQKFHAMVRNSGIPRNSIAVRFCTRWEKHCLGPDPVVLYLLRNSTLSLSLKEIPVDSGDTWTHESERKSSKGPGHQDVE